jgi:hypothetical protein
MSSDFITYIVLLPTVDLYISRSLCVSVVVVSYKNIRNLYVCYYYYYFITTPPGEIMQFSGTHMQSWLSVWL